MKDYNFESDWGQYTFPNNHSEFATDDYIFNTFNKVNLNAKTYDTSGIPLIIRNGKAAVVDDDSHTIIYGETGSKKTRSCIRPLITTVAGARQSMIVTDVKGELSTDPKIIGWLKYNNIQSVILDFKNFKCDGYNILQYPYELFMKGEEDKAMGSILRLVSAMTAKYNDTKADPFWNDMAQTLIIPTVRLLFECCKNKKDYFEFINLLSLSTFFSHNTDVFEKIVNKVSERVTNNYTHQLKTVFGTADKTKVSIVAVTNSLFADFLCQESLLKMLSVTTFNINEAYEKPLCVFLVIPDETSAYDHLSGIIIDNLYSHLVEVYGEKYQNTGKSPKCLINFICDEFCNVRINDMSAKISASRSRNMKWYLVCQSKSQLEASYEKEATTIIGNCKNCIFLQSSDYEMLSYISRQCGMSNITQSEHPELLITPEELSNMRKNSEYKEALFIRDNIKYCARLNDIDQYTFLDKHKVENVAKFVHKLKDKKLSVYTPEMMYSDIMNKVISIPFTDCVPDEIGKRNKTDESYNIQEELAREFNELFGSAQEKIKPNDDYTVKPEDFEYISDEDMNGDYIKIDVNEADFFDDEEEENEVLHMTIESLDLTVRAFNCLKRAEVNTIDDLIKKSSEEMKSIRNLGKRSFNEIREKLLSLGLVFEWSNEAE
ncbi:MAG: type IV secretory system conjugative DNA transfer family protein [Oscillospiraceae bacterium]|nr:type IV secretory system conjugative DNA transfer family protein [Oscillospiraceae bacterium]